MINSKAKHECTNCGAVRSFKGWGKWFKFPCQGKSTWEDRAESALPAASMPSSLAALRPLGPATITQAHGHRLVSRVQGAWICLDCHVEGKWGNFAEQTCDGNFGSSPTAAGPQEREICKWEGEWEQLRKVQKEEATPRSGPMLPTSSGSEQRQRC